MSEKVCVGSGSARVSLVAARGEDNQQVVLAIPESFEDKVKAKLDEERQIQRIMNDLNVGVERRRYGMAKFKKKKVKDHERQHN